MNQPQEYQIWLRSSKRMRWMPLNILPRSLADCERGIQILRENALRTHCSIVVLLGGEVPDPERMVTADGGEDA